MHATIFVDQFGSSCPGFVLSAGGATVHLPSTVPDLAERDARDGGAAAAAALALDGDGVGAPHWHPSGRGLEERLPTAALRA